MTDTNSKEIFVSYAWGGESEKFVDQIVQTFSQAGYTISRDKSHLTYRNSIRDFMERIGRGKFIIAVVSDKYMKSEYCMYEAYRMFQSPQFSKRVYPIVLPDADIFSFSGQQKYIRHWIEAVNQVETEIKTLASEEPAMVGPLIERLRDYEVTSRFVNDFMASVADMNVLTPDIHKESNFKLLLDMVETDEAPPAPQVAMPGPEAAEKVGETIEPDRGGPAPASAADLENDFAAKDRLVEALENYMLAGAPISPRQIAQNLISATYWPSPWKKLRISTLSENANMNARGLVDFAISSGHLPAPNQALTALGNLLGKARDLLSAKDLAAVDEIIAKYNL